MSRPLFSYRDLAYYLKEGEALRSFGLRASLEKLGYLANPLWALLISLFYSIFKGYSALWWMAFALSLLRDALVLVLFSRYLRIGMLLYAFLVAVLPYPLVYAFNFSSDLFASLAVTLFFVPFVLAARLSVRMSGTAFCLTTCVLAVLAFLRSNLIPLSIVLLLFSILQLRRIVRRGEARGGKRAWLVMNIAALLAAALLSVVAVLLSAAYFGRFSASANGMGILSYASILKVLTGWMGSVPLARLLAILATPVVHTLSFFSLREATYLEGAASAIDIGIAAVNFVVFLPAIILMLRKPLSVFSVCTFLLLLPCLFGVSHARYSFPLHSIYVFVGLAFLLRRQSIVADLDLRYYFVTT